MISMMRMRGMRLKLGLLSLGLLVLSVISCGYRPLPALLDLELLAGNIGGSGNADGVGTAARFDRPQGVVVDSAGNLYIADTANHTIRKATPDGDVSTLAGSAGYHGTADGSGVEARFGGPRSVAVDSAGNVYVADSGNHTIRKITPAGVVTTLAGTAGMSGSADGSGAAARFYYPAGVAVDSAGNLYVADSNNNTIRKVTPTGVVTTLAGAAGMYEHADGSGALARFRSPYGVAVDRAGNVYVADRNNCAIRKVTPAGIVTTLAGDNYGFPICGSADGTGSAARFSHLAGVAVDSAGNVYVADEWNSTIRRVTAGGIVTTLAGVASTVGNADGWGPAASFDRPSGVAVDDAGNIYVADQGNSTIRKVTAGRVVTTLAGAANMDGSADGSGTVASFRGPIGVAVDRDGNTYVADHFNSTIRKITSEKVVITLAGSANVHGSMDALGPSARFSYPSGVAVDDAGNVYVADMVNRTIRKVTPEGVVTTLAGTAGVSGWFPSGVAVDSAGNVYVADTGRHTIRRVTPDGVVTTLAGNAGTLGNTDGPGAGASFNSPSGVAVDSAGNVYVADTKNHTIRKVTPDGVVTTLAGTAGAPGWADGIGAEARFNFPSGVAVDNAGNVYVADTNGATIRKITATGITTTIAGTAGTVGIDLGLTPRFASPRGLAVVGDSIVISDANAILLLHHGAQ